MTEEDKKLIADYMGWEKGIVDSWRPKCRGSLTVHFDLNDAGLCAKKMQKHGEDWDNFITYAEADTEKQCQTWSQLFAWLYDADNFFAAMAAWLKEEKK